MCTLYKFMRVKDDPMKSDVWRKKRGNYRLLISDSPLKVGYGTCFMSPLYKIS